MYWIYSKFSLWKVTISCCVRLYTYTCKYLSCKLDVQYMYMYTFAGLGLRNTIILFMLNKLHTNKLAILSVCQDYKLFWNQEIFKPHFHCASWLKASGTFAINNSRKCYNSRKTKWYVRKKLYNIKSILNSIHVQTCTCVHSAELFCSMNPVPVFNFFFIILKTCTTTSFHKLQLIM